MKTKKYFWRYETRLLNDEYIEGYLFENDFHTGETNYNLSLDRE